MIVATKIIEKPYLTPFKRRKHQNQNQGAVVLSLVCAQHLTGGASCQFPFNSSTIICVLNFNLDAVHLHLRVSHFKKFKSQSSTNRLLFPGYHLQTSFRCHAGVCIYLAQGYSHISDHIYLLCVFVDQSSFFQGTV